MPPVLVPVPLVPPVLAGLVTVVSQALTSVITVPALTAKPSIDAACTRKSRRGVLFSGASIVGKVSVVFINIKNTVVKNVVKQRLKSTT